jgi:hypothetical protein
MARLGREFEKLIARIEQTLAPTGAIVTSPDRIRDCITGNDREVDASIRYTSDSGPILITVECRDRTTAQDITWLEQIKSKKESIVADQTIVVSREGFTKGAISYANHHGIVLRQMPEVTDEFWLQCLKGLKVFTREMRCHMISFNIGFFPNPGDEGLEQLSITNDVTSAIEENKPFAINKSGEKITLEELYREILPELKAELAEYLDSDESEFNSQDLIEGNCECDAMFAPNDIAIETVRGTRYIQVIIFGIKYEVRNERLPPLRPMQYKDEAGRVVDAFSMTEDRSISVRIKTGWDRQ